MGRIQELLAADEANTRVTPDLIRALDQWALGAFDDAASLFRLLYRVLGDWPTERALDPKLHQMAERHGLSDEQLIELLKAGQATHVEGATEAWAKMWTFRLAKYPVMACQRYWSYGATELFRLRHTATLGYLRLEAESMALVLLFLQDDALAHRWADLTKENAHQFFRDTQPRVKAVLKQFDLNNTYDIASGSFQHVRMAGLVRSMMNSKPGQLSLPDQEFNIDDPYSFQLGVAHFHRVQSRIFAGLGSAIPDARTDEWINQEAAFANNAAALWKVLEQRYAKNIQEQASGDAV